jgi:hypothetical protein
VSTSRDDAEEPEVLEQAWPDELVEDLDRELHADLQHLPATVRARLLADNGTVSRLRGATYQARGWPSSPPP